MSENKMICKNCGHDYTEEYERIVRELKDLKNRLHFLERRKRIMESGFCDSYCEFKYHEG